MKCVYPQVAFDCQPFASAPFVLRYHPLLHDLDRALHAARRAVDLAPITEAPRNRCGDLLRCARGNRGRRKGIPRVAVVSLERMDGEASIEGDPGIHLDPRA